MPRFLKQILIFLAGIAVSFVVCIGVFALLTYTHAPSFFEGVSLRNKLERISPPIGVMIENELLARPFQKGLSEAVRVYEAPTEGGITRFLAIFPQDKLPEKMGPIRSARTYFLDWMSEFKGMYMHVGGNSDVLKRLSHENNVFNADQFVYDRYFRRENLDRTVLEHTMFTRRAWIEKLMNDEKWFWQPPAHIFASPVKKNYDDAPAATKIELDFGLLTYNVSYEYDAATCKYMRFQAKRPHIDAQNQKQIVAGTVVVQKVKWLSNGDAEGSISIKTIAGGDATIFQNGHAIKATWKKESLESPTRFFDAATGEEISLYNSPVWIEVMRDFNSFAYEQEKTELHAQFPDRVPVLMYHHIGKVPADQKNNAVRQDLTVSAENFESQLKWLKENGYSSISFGMLRSSEMVGRVNSSAMSSVGLPQKSIILSFDDGYSDAHTIALPLLKKYGMFGCFGIITDSVGKSEYLTWDQIKEMQKEGMAFVSHTVSHPDLRTISDAALKKELAESKLILEEKLGGEISTFIYPAGKYNKKIAGAVSAAGYKLARTTASGVATKDSAPLELPTIRIHGSSGIEAFAAALK